MIMLNQFDVARDYHGTFYAPNNWKYHHCALQEVLCETFNCEFKDDYNSFESCFIFKEKYRKGKLYKKIKIYNKILDLI